MYRRASSESASTSTADDALRPATRGPARSPEVASRRQGNGVLDSVPGSATFTDQARCLGDTMAE